MNKALIIFNENGTIMSCTYGDIVVPKTIQYMVIDVPDGEQLNRMDMTDPEHPEPVFESNFIGDFNKVMTAVEGVQRSVDDVNKNTAKLAHVATVAAFSFTDEQALTVPELYPDWYELPDGTTLTAQAEATKGTEITRVRGDEDKLYKVIQTHQKQSDWVPGVGTESLFTVIDVEHAGTMEDPIPYDANMIVYTGKVYTYNGVLYQCIRDSGIALQHTPDQLIGNYFEAAE